MASLAAARHVTEQRLLSVPDPAVRLTLDRATSGMRPLVSRTRKQGAEGLLGGSQFPRGRLIPVFHLALAFAEGNVVGRGFDTQDEAELVIPLDRVLPKPLDSLRGVARRSAS